MLVVFTTSCTTRHDMCNVMLSVRSRPNWSKCYKKLVARVLHCLQDPSELTDETNEAPRPYSDHLTVFPDVLPMQIKFGSIEQRAMLMKQITCVGARHWMQGDVWDEFDADPNHRHLKIWLFSSDQGGDQQGSHLICMSDVADDATILMFRQFCMLHQVALIVKRTLASLDPYWSRLSKLINVWRAASNAKRLFLDFDKHILYDCVACAGFMHLSMQL